jgi:hypothetical protein
MVEAMKFNGVHPELVKFSKTTFLSQMTRSVLVSTQRKKCSIDWQFQVSLQFIKVPFNTFTFSQWRNEGGVWSFQTNHPRNSESSPKSCQNQPDM